MNEQEDSRNQTTPEESDVGGFEQREPSADEATEAVGDEEGQSTSCLPSGPLADPELDLRPLLERELRASTLVAARTISATAQHNARRPKAERNDMT